ncbi:MAG: bifunctional ornithine acetyltransferase/N-acetylglutamate synthase, partial [Porticoccaceae bacterium]
MAVGKDTMPDKMHPVAGFRLGTASAGIKTSGRRDLVVMALAAGSTVAGVFTRNAFCAAPVQVAKAHLEQGTVRYLITNTGNANAGAGRPGITAARAVCAEVARLGGVAEHQVLPFSTGVIGQTLPVDKILAALPVACADLREDGWHDAAHGILTTDTRSKGASRQLSIGGRTVTITGIAKGSGMI